ncbi:FABP family protein [Acidithrix ferrooxidans]|uniref:THAP4-like heme-binding domain-containing protein n=1 Tax=Acidithrix ferrooxidans TaxID=1280514 RepID=A0A0D8HFE5_9ACTN|nr:FABP family protein [Acidithrix ferrooxidans]KJF16507.1 hypothetical protein AXFE_26720 [Acidithrix ferrooxidans]
MENGAVIEAVCGRFVGRGSGTYPTIADFEYNEITIFSLSKKGFIKYSQGTTSIGDDTPMHQEMGYLRLGADQSVEFLVVQPTGLTEVSVGSVAILGDGSVEISSGCVPMSSPSAKAVRRIERKFTFDSLGLAYWISMATNDVFLSHHLSGVLTRKVSVN